MKLKPQRVSEYLKHVGEDHEEYWFMCPGCRFDHRVIVRWGSTSGRNNPTWSFNGNLDKPTFQPSLLVQWQDVHDKKVCHSYITDGRIQFLPDCTHELAGQTVEMEEVDAGS